MGLDALKQQLASGEITLETFKAEAQKLLDSETITQEEFDAVVNEGGQGGANGGNGGGFDIQQVLNHPEFQKFLQSSEDKVRTEYSKRLKEKEKELEDIKKQQMSEDEKKQYELDQAKKELEEKTAALQQREVALHTVDKLTSEGLPLNFKSILAGSTVEETDENIKVFKAEWDKAMQDEISRKFKEKGKNPGSGHEPSGEKNPFSKEHHNLTLQGQMIQNDPEKARRMATQAGAAIYW